MKRSLLFFSLVSIIFLLHSCASISQYQTAKPMGEGNISHRLSINGNIREGDGGSPPIIAEYGINYGATKNFDFVGKLNMYGSLSVGGKYTFIGDSMSKVYLAIGPTMNIFGKIVNFTTPLHFTIEPSSRFAFTFTPSYTSPGLYKLKDNADSYYKNINSGFFSFSPYFEVGNKVRFIIGCNFAFTNNVIYTDYGLGVRLNILPKLRS